MAVKATVLGGSAKDLALDAEVFEAEVKPHLVHETVRAELNAARRGTRGAKSRGLVSGGRSKPVQLKVGPAAHSAAVAPVRPAKRPVPSKRKAPSTRRR